MRDVIQRILASEAEAKQIVAAARAEGEGIVAGARNAAEGLRDRMNQEVRGEAERILAEAARAVVGEKEARLARAAAEIEDRIRLDPELRRRVVAEVVRCVCGATATAKEEA